jgi:hypothetical protein
VRELGALPNHSASTGEQLHKIHVHAAANATNNHPDSVHKQMTQHIASTTSINAQYRQLHPAEDEDDERDGQLGLRGSNGPRQAEEYTSVHRSLPALIIQQTGSNNVEEMRQATMLDGSVLHAAVFRGHLRQDDVAIRAVDGTSQYGRVMKFIRTEPSVATSYAIVHYYDHMLPRHSLLPDTPLMKFANKNAQHAFAVVNLTAIQKRVHVVRNFSDKSNTSFFLNNFSFH